MTNPSARGSLLNPNSTLPAVGWQPCTTPRRLEEWPIYPTHEAFTNLRVRMILTSFWWYFIATLSFAKSWHFWGSSSSLWSSLWLRMISNSRELRAWSKRSLAKRLHCCESSSYSALNSFSTLLSSFSSQPSRKAVRMGSSLDKAINEGLAKAL